MRRTTVLFVMVLTAVASVPMPAAAQSEQVTLTVSVVNQGNQPVSGATITASWDGGNATATTRANGKALVDVPKGARVEIDAASDRYVRNLPYVVENAQGQSVEVSVAQKGSADITVRNTEGQRVADATVRLWQNGSLVVRGRTNQNGVLKSKTIEQGEYQLVVFNEGAYRNRTSLQVDGQVQKTMTIESGSVTVTFDVVDDHFDPAKPVKDANIEVAGITSGIATLQDGEATLAVPVNDVYQVTVTKGNYTEVSREVPVGEQSKTVNFTINRAPSISITPSTDRVVTGESVSIQVTDEYGTPVKNATVQLDGNTVGKTNAEGRISIPIESAGEHTISASHGRLSTEYTIEGVKAATTKANETDTKTTTKPSSGFGPGFGPVAVAGAVLALALLARRRD